MVNTFVIFAARVVGYVVDSFARRDGGGGLGFGYFIVVIVAEIIFGIAASAIVMVLALPGVPGRCGRMPSWQTAAT